MIKFGTAIGIAVLASVLVFTSGCKTTSRKEPGRVKEGLGAYQAGAPTWCEVNGTVYGAKANQDGPAGGGPGYTKLVTSGDYTVQDLDSLLDALQKAKPGEVIYIPDETVIDLTARVYVDGLVLVLPDGVTLAGNRGHLGSRGALLVSRALNTPIMLKVKGFGTRVTGLRLQGPNPELYDDHYRYAQEEGRRKDGYYYKFPTSSGILAEYSYLEVDNCEISGFSFAAVRLKKGERHHLHHNYIHHCRQVGLGYGVVLDEASTIIEYNIFFNTSHAVAGTGIIPCEFSFQNNVQAGETIAPYIYMKGASLKDLVLRKVDLSRITINPAVWPELVKLVGILYSKYCRPNPFAGTYLNVSNNTFLSSQATIEIQGEPKDKAELYRNWFVAEPGPQNVLELEKLRKIPTNIALFDNVFGRPPSLIE